MYTFVEPTKLLFCTTTYFLNYETLTVVCENQVYSWNINLTLGFIVSSKASGTCYYHALSVSETGHVCDACCHPRIKINCALCSGGAMYDKDRLLQVKSYPISLRKDFFVFLMCLPFSNSKSSLFLENVIPLKM